MLALTGCVGCSEGGGPGDGAAGAAAGGTGGGSTGAGVGGAGLAGAGGSGGTGAASGGAGMTSGLADGEGFDADAGSAAVSSGMGGSAGGRPPDAGAGASGGASPGGAPGAGGSGDASARCAQIATEYASSFNQQITCNPGAGDQCQDRIEAAPGCDCLVFIEPKDPFAIEHLTNVFIDYLDADCENPMCPDTCPGGTRGVCGSNGLCTSGP